MEIYELQVYSKKYQGTKPITTFLFFKEQKAIEKQKEIEKEFNERFFFIIAKRDVK